VQEAPVAAKLLRLRALTGAGRAKNDDAGYRRKPS
jgi:hypothetical protein